MHDAVTGIAKRGSPVRRAVASAAVLFSGSVVACGGRSAPTEPASEIAASVTISGPDTVQLSCSLEGSASYSVAQVEGPISSYAWKIDGKQVGSGDNTEVGFSDIGAHTVHLDAFGGTGALLTSADKSVVARPPGDLESCASESRIEGRFGVLIPTSASSADVVYSVRLPAAIQGHVDLFTWMINRTGGVQEILASGAGASSVSVTFSDEGAYTLTLEEVVDGNAVSLALDVQVRRGEALAEPGTIALFRRFGLSGPPTIYLLDAASGFLSRPLLHEDEVTSRGSCSDSMLVFNKGDPNSDGVVKNNVYAINLDGSNHHRIIQEEGNVSGPSLRGNLVAVVDDTRWNYLRDELAVLNLSTGNYTYLAGTKLDSAYVGFWPALSPDGAEIALGSVENDAIGKSRKGIVLYSSGGRILGALHTRDFGQLYGSDSAIEGVSGVAWDPRGEYVAFDVLVGDEHAVIALGAIDGSEVRILGEGWGPVYWSPSGDHILFQEHDRELQSNDLMIMNRDGTGRTDITRMQLGSDATVSDISAGYCRG